MSTATPNTPKPAQRPVGVEAALKASANDAAPSPTLFTQEFSLADRVALVTGGCGDLGLEIALALIEAGTRVVYCIDLHKEPTEKWQKVKEYSSRMTGKGGEGRLEYISADVTNQEKMWKIGEEIGNKEGRFDICVTGHGIAPPPTATLEFPAALFQKVLDANTNGVLYTAQAAGRQMARFGNGGSIILLASIAGSLAFKNIPVMAYNVSKAAVIQLARTMACELGLQGIRVNSLSPSFIYTAMTSAYIDNDPAMFANMVPLGKPGQPHQLRGVVAWLASDASSLCTGSDIVVDGGHTAW